MKNKITIAIMLSTSVIYANSDYMVIVDKEHHKYNHDEGILVVETTEWTNLGDKKCFIDLYEDDFYYGEQFTQVEDCEQVQERTVTTYRKYENGNKTIESVKKESQTIEESVETILVGTHLENNCKEIIDNGYSLGDREYRISFNGGMDVTCDMTRSGGGWTQLSNYDFNENPDNIPPNLVKTVNRTITAYYGGQHTLTDGWYHTDITSIDYTQFNWTEVAVSTNGMYWTQTMIDIDSNFEISTDGYRVSTTSRDSTTVNGQYVDGVSLTYGNNGSRNHLFTQSNSTTDVSRISWLNNSDSNTFNDYGIEHNMSENNAFVSDLKPSGDEQISARLMVNQLSNDEMVGLRKFKVWIK